MVHRDEGLQSSASSLGRETLEVRLRHPLPPRKSGRETRCIIPPTGLRGECQDPRTHPLPQTESSRIGEWGIRTRELDDGWGARGGYQNGPAKRPRRRSIFGVAAGRVHSRRGIVEAGWPGVRPRGHGDEAEDSGEVSRWEGGRTPGTGEDAGSGDPGIYVAWDTRLREPVHSNLRHLRTEQDPPTPAPWTVATASYSPRSVEVSLNGFYRGTSPVPRVRCDLCVRGSVHQDGSLHPHQLQCHGRTNRRNIAMTRPSRKLDFKRFGPFKILKVIGESKAAFQLQLPPQWQIHDVFHASLLDPHQQNDIKGRKQLVPQPPDIVEGTPEYEVEEILDSKRRGRGRELWYLVDWKGYSPEERTWEPAKNLTHAEEVVAAYHQRHPQRPSPNDTTDTPPRGTSARKAGGYCHERIRATSPTQGPAALRSRPEDWYWSSSKNSQPLRRIFP